MKKQQLESCKSKHYSFPSKAEHTTSCLAGWLPGSLGGFLSPLRLGQKEPLLGQVSLEFFCFGLIARCVLETGIFPLVKMFDSCSKQLFLGIWFMVAFLLAFARLLLLTEIPLLLFRSREDSLGNLLQFWFWHTWFRVKNVGLSLLTLSRNQSFHVSCHNV